MRSPQFERTRPTQQRAGSEGGSGFLTLGPRGGHFHLRHREPALGERAGFVDANLLQSAQPLEVRRSLDQHTPPRRAREPAHGHHRGRQHQRARTRHHEEHARHVGVLGTRVAGGVGDGGQEQRGQNHDGGVVPRERLHGSLHPRARRLRLLHESHQPGDGAVGSRRRHPHLQRPALVHRAAVHLVPRGFGHRDALTGEGRLVHRGGSFHDDAVEGHLVSGLDQDHLADCDILDGNLLLGRRQPPRLLRPQRQHRTHGGRGPAHRAVLEPLADPEQRDDRGSLAKVLQSARPRDGDCHQRVDVHDSVAERPGGFARDGGYAHHHRPERHPAQVFEVAADVVQQGHRQERARQQNCKRGGRTGAAAPTEVRGVG